MPLRSQGPEVYLWDSFSLTQYDPVKVCATMVKHKLAKFWVCQKITLGLTNYFLNVCIDKGCLKSFYIYLKAEGKPLPQNLSFILVGYCLLSRQTYERNS